MRTDKTRHMTLSAQHHLPHKKWRSTPWN